MYTAEECISDDLGNPGTDWVILDKDGDWICTVGSEGQAENLLSHLNK